MRKRNIRKNRAEFTLFSQEVEELLSVNKNTCIVYAVSAYACCDEFCSRSSKSLTESSNLNVGKGSASKLLTEYVSEFVSSLKRLKVYLLCVAVGFLCAAKRIEIRTLSRCLKLNSLCLQRGSLSNKLFLLLCKSGELFCRSALRSAFGYDGCVASFDLSKSCQNLCQCHSRFLLISFLKFLFYLYKLGRPARPAVGLFRPNPPCALRI